MLDASEIIIGGTGRIHIAPEGATLPAHLSASLSPSFVDLGYTTADGAKFTDSKTTNDVRPWQSFYPVRTHITERSGMIETSLLQWNIHTIQTAFGGGTFSEPFAGEFRYSPPSPETLAIVTVVVDIADGDRNFRICVPRAFVTSNTESTFAKTGPAMLPVTFAILANGAGDPWTFDSDDVAWIAEVS